MLHHRGVLNAGRGSRSRAEASPTAASGSTRCRCTTSARARRPSSGRWPIAAPTCSCASGTRGSCSSSSRPTAARPRSSCRRCCWPCWIIRTARRRDLSSIETIYSGAAVVPAALVRRTKETLELRVLDLVRADRAQRRRHRDALRPTAPRTRPRRSGSRCRRRRCGSRTGRRARRCRSGERGDICVRGYQTMVGYFERADETAETLDADGWLWMGDIGTMDDRGYVTITGRSKEMIIRGGINVYPREIEDVLFGARRRRPGRGRRRARREVGRADRRGDPGQGPVLSPVARRAEGVLPAEARRAQDPRGVDLRRRPSRPQRPARCRSSCSWTRSPAAIWSQ